MNQPYALSRGACTQDVDSSGLKLPAFIQKVLADFGLLGAFLSRPYALQLGLVGPIVAADRQELQDERIAQMLDELVLDQDTSPN